MFALYIQDDWRVNDRLTLNLGVRWDYVDGMPIDQDSNPNFQVLQAAGRAGRFANDPGIEDFGQDPQGDKDNIQPRIGFAFDVRGDGGDVVRGGWGVYHDFGYTNANALFPALDAAGGHGTVFFVQNPAGIRKPDGSFYSTSEPMSAIASLNEAPVGVAPLLGQTVSPLLQQPYTRQTNLGWAHELTRSTALTVDFVNVQGGDLSIRFRANQLVNGVRRYGDLALRPNTNAQRFAISDGFSDYSALIIGMRRRMSNGLDLSASYTLADAKSIIGTANDELDTNLIQDVRDPFGDVQNAPSARTDARHRAVVQRCGPGSMGDPGVAALPLSLGAADAHVRGDRPQRRRQQQRQHGARLSLHWHQRPGRRNVRGRWVLRERELQPACAVLADEPASEQGVQAAGRDASRGDRGDLQPLQCQEPGHPGYPHARLSATGAPLTSFMQPTAFAGDFRQPEQRVGQIGFRFTF